VLLFKRPLNHLGVGSPAEGEQHDATDSIYNGADDAVEQQNVIMLQIFKNQ
jgi:hypothetical protein